MNGIVNAGSLNVRNAPSVSGKIVGGLQRNSQVEITGQEGHWYQIRYSNKDAYVYKDFIDIGPGFFQEYFKIGCTFSQLIRKYRTSHHGSNVGMGLPGQFKGKHGGGQGIAEYR